MNYKLLLIPLVFLTSCFKSTEKNKLIVYPEYCGGCVQRNFESISNYKLINQFDVYFDTTDSFILNESKKNSLSYQHINKGETRKKFGDFANLIVIDLDGNKIELKTNETLTKGVHFK